MPDEYNLLNISNLLADNTAETTLSNIKTNTDSSVFKTFELYSFKLCHVHPIEGSVLTASSLNLSCAVKYSKVLFVVPHPLLKIRQEI